MVSQLNEYIRRYTTLSNALYTLNQKKLVLMNPTTWDDKNDIQFMELYKEHIKAKSLFALCCTSAGETYHHWKVFAQGIEGICIEFHRNNLETALASNPNVRFNRVAYKPVEWLEGASTAVADELPFIKRDGFSDEREWRIISHTQEIAKHTLEIDLDTQSISRLILSPWMPPSLGDNIRSLIRGIPGCDSMPIESSRLTNSKRWKAAGRKLVPQTH